MEAEYRMYDHDRVENGEDAFPDACEGCPHYGGAVRLLRGARHKRSWIESPSRPRTARRSKRNSRARHPARLSPHSDVDHAVGTRYEGLVEEGWDIYLSIEIDVGLMDSPGAEMKVDLSADDDGGGY